MSRVHSGLKASVPTEQDAGVSGQRLTYAVGDIHGCLGLALAAFDAIEADAGERGADIVCLGDYVDRGPDSRGVIELLMAGPRRAGDTLVCLKGNHEELMAESGAGDLSATSCWLGNGGRETIASYGHGGVPPEHFSWASGLPVMVADDHRVFVHAGLMPGFSPEGQDPATCMWIRDRFLRCGDEWGVHIVHGHTPQWDGKPDPTQPELLPHRTNLDTGACWTGVLTVGVFDAEIAGGPIRVLPIKAVTDLSAPAMGTERSGVNQA